MAVDFPDGLTGLADVWRIKFDDVYRRYSESPTADSRAEVMRVLRTFADLVLRDKLPLDQE
jgi:hypothetical protein